MSFRAIMAYARLNGFLSVIIKNLPLAFEDEYHLTVALMLVVTDR